MEEQVFGGIDDHSFWSDKPIQKGHPLRRSSIEHCTPVEKMICEVAWQVENLGADVRLTEAINKLKEARELIADFVDGVKRE